MSEFPTRLGFTARLQAQASRLFGGAADWLLAHQNVLIGLVLVFAIGQSYRQAAVAFHTPTNSDIYYLAAKRLVAGQTFYVVGDKDPFKYSPVIGLLMAPLALFSQRWADAIWCFAMIACTAGICWVLTRIAALAYPELKGRRAARLVALALAASVWTYLNHYSYGQAHILIPFFVFLALYEHQKKRYWLAGIWLSFAISVKLTPVLFLGYLLLKRDWRMLAWSILGLGFTFLICVVAFGGFTEALRVHQEFVHLLIVRPEHQMWNPFVYFQNQNVQSLFTSYFTQEPIYIHGVSKKLAYVPLSFLKAAFFIFTAVLGARIAVMMLRSRAGVSRDESLLVDYSLVLMIATLYSPLAWPYTYVGIIGLNLVALKMLGDLQGEGRLAVWGVWAFLLNQVAMDSAFVLPATYNTDPLSFNLVCMTTLALFVWTVVAFDHKLRAAGLSAELKAPPVRAATAG